MQATLRQLFFDEKGQDLAEYALVVSLVALGCVASAKTLCDKIANALTSTGSSLVSATG